MPEYLLAIFFVLQSKMQYQVLQDEIEPTILNENQAHENMPKSCDFHANSQSLQTFHLLVRETEIRICGTLTSPLKLLASGDDVLHLVLENGAHIKEDNGITINFRDSKNPSKNDELQLQIINRNFINKFSFFFQTSMLVLRRGMNK